MIHFYTFLVASIDNHMYIFAICDLLEDKPACSDTAHVTDSRNNGRLYFEVQCEASYSGNWNMNSTAHCSSTNEHNLPKTDSQRDEFEDSSIGNDVVGELHCLLSFISLEENCPGCMLADNIPMYNFTLLSSSIRNIVTGK